MTERKGLYETFCEMGEPNGGPGEYFICEFKMAWTNLALCRFDGDANMIYNAMCQSYPDKIFCIMFENEILISNQN